MTKEHISVKKMWEDFLTSIGEDITITNKKYTSWYFCNNEESADHLAELVKKGIKRGTTSLYDLYKIENEELPAPYNYSVITNWHGIAQCIIKTVKVTILPFKDVDSELAKIEGEGDHSLKYWQEVHTDVYTAELKDLGMHFTPDTVVVFEEFEVAYQ